MVRRPFGRPSRVQFQPIAERRFQLLVVRHVVACRVYPEKLVVGGHDIQVVRRHRLETTGAGLIASRKCGKVSVLEG